MAFDDDFAARLLDGRADAPAVTLWWPRHVASVLAHAAAPASRRPATGARVAAVARQWGSFLGGSRGADPAASLVCEHARIETRIAEAMAARDAAGLRRLADDLAGNVRNLGMVHANYLAGFPERRFCSLVARHAALLADAAARAGSARSPVPGDDLRANTLALARMTTEWLAGAPA